MRQFFLIIFILMAFRAYSLPGGKDTVKGKRDWAKSSVLSSGTWYKIGVVESNVYRINKDLIIKSGIDPMNLDPDHIRVFGNGGKMLPQPNSGSFIDDLKEIPVLPIGGGDNRFDGTDEVLFFAEGPGEWVYLDNAGIFTFRKNNYSDTAFYYILINSPNGKKIPNQAFDPKAADTLEYYYENFSHEMEYFTEINEKVKSGRNWFGEEFSSEKTSIPFSFYSKPSEVKGRARTAIRSVTGSSLKISTPSGLISKDTVPAIDIRYEADYVIPRITSFSLSDPQRSGNILFELETQSDAGKGWVDYLELTGKSQLHYNGGKVLMNIFSPGPGIKFHFKGSFSGEKPLLWDITDLHSPVNKELNIPGSEFYFSASGDTLKRFFLFDKNSVGLPLFIKKIPNQNLHGVAPVNYLIITHPLFRKEAEELGNFHREQGLLSVGVIDIRKIYNEFGSGMPDITGIRNFIRHMYEKGENSGIRLKYVLFFGDASYDYKDRVENNTNFIPSYQTRIAYSPIHSWVTDDYYGYLDEDEGYLDRINKEDLRYDMDVAIGRIPVSTAQQAKDVVNKIKLYSRGSVRDNWRRKMVFIADDEDVNDHLNNAENLAKIVENQTPEVLLEKLYFDAFEQEKTTFGENYPQVNARLKKNIEDGALIINYVGHGSEYSLSYENVLDINDIKSWKNLTKLPLFITATCEFTRFDDPSHISGGEWILLNPNGGGIGLLTTTRLVFSGSNFNLSKKIFNQNIFSRDSLGNALTLGDIFLTAKNRDDKGKLTENTRKFALIGDPALRLNLPENSVKITKVNGVPDSSLMDTLPALQNILLEGDIRLFDENIATGFEGEVDFIFYNGMKTKTTLANDKGSYPQNFNVLEDVLLKGKSRVRNGMFSITLAIPELPGSPLRKGMLFLYASEKKSDAFGYFELTIDPDSVNATSDNPPYVKVTMDGEGFKNGDAIRPDPLLNVYLTDDFGLDVTGVKFGHEPRFYLDGQGPEFMGEYFTPVTDTVKSGYIQYKMEKMFPGWHKLIFKAWDFSGQMGADTVDFLVRYNDEAEIGNVIVYPTPSKGTLNFKILHNRKNDHLKIKIEILSLEGLLIETLEKTSFSGNRDHSEFSWNCRDSRGIELKNGMYFYILSVTSSDGSMDRQTGKWMLIK